MVAPLIPIAAIAAAGGYALYEYMKKKKLPVLQSLRATSPTTGTPIQVVVPVANQPKAVSGVSATPLHPNNQGSGAAYAPAPVVVSSTPGQLTLAPTVITPNGAASLAVNTAQDIQNALNTLGYGPLTVDGKIGPLSIAAIKKFQVAQGLAVDGIAGPNTKGALQSALATLAGPNSAVGSAATTLAASGDPPARVGFGGRWSSGLGSDFGRHHKRSRKRPPPPQPSGNGGGNGNGGGGDGSDGGDGGDGDAGFGIGVVIPSTYHPPSADNDDSSDYGGEFGSSRMRGLAGYAEVRPSFDRMDRHEAPSFQSPTAESGCTISTIHGVQHALNLLGASPPLVESGIYDTKTIAAVKAFQIIHGLVADGVAKEKTKWAICVALNPNLAPLDEDECDGSVKGELKSRVPGFG
jgi:peptidoglycan hydrolase-like protein with peptidoglycan-binding domain